jgi:hypothetical protein
MNEDQETAAIVAQGAAEVESAIRQILGHCRTALVAGGMPDTLAEAEMVLHLAPHEVPAKLPDGKVAICAYFESDGLWDATWQRTPCFWVRSVPSERWPWFAETEYQVVDGPDRSFATHLKEADGFVGTNGIRSTMLETFDRVDILLPAGVGQDTLTFLEGYLRLFWKPRFSQTPAPARGITAEEADRLAANGELIRARSE